MKRIEMFKRVKMSPRRKGFQIDSTRKVSLCLQCLMFVVLRCGRLCLGPPFVNFAPQFCCHSWPSMFHHALARKKCTLQKEAKGKVFDVVFHHVKFCFFFQTFFKWLSNTIFEKKLISAGFLLNIQLVILKIPSRLEHTVGSPRGMRLILDGFGFPLYLGSSLCHS